MQWKYSEDIISWRKRKLAMAMARRFGSGAAVAMVAFVAVLSMMASVKGEESEEDVDYIVPLDHTNFTDFVYKQDFIVVEFYAPWCGACKGFYPEYKKAAKKLNGYEPQIILAKIDASAEESKPFRDLHGVRGYPTVKVFRKQGKLIEEYFEKLKADFMVPYFKKLAGPPSTEIKSAEDATNLINDKSISIVGLFPEFSGEEYDNFTELAEKMRTKFEFGHTLDAKLLPRRERFNRPTLRMFKPFDDIFVDFQNFDVSAMRSFILASSTPVLTMFDGEELNKKYVDKFFRYPKAKAMLFVNFSQEYDAFKPKYYDLAKSYKKKGIRFLIGDTEVGQKSFKYFALSRDQAPLVIIYDQDGSKYLKSNVAPNDIAPWLKDYKDGKLEQYIRSQPIPEGNDKPVKVVVRDTLQKMVFESGKDVVLNLYESLGCGLCKRLAPILDEIALEFAHDQDIMFAKLDANANDFSDDVFPIEDFPAMYLVTASGKTILYEGSKRFKKEEIIEFIQKNRDSPAKTESVKEDLEKPDTEKDEL